VHDVVDEELLRLEVQKHEGAEGSADERETDEDVAGAEGDHGPTDSGRASRVT
jgi:hypothetical protein